MDPFAVELENKILNLKCVGPCNGFMFAPNVEQHKTTYQVMLALSMKTDYIAYNPGKRVHHFINGIMVPSLTKAKFSLFANPE